MRRRIQIWSVTVAVIWGFFMPARGLAIEENRAVFYPYYSDKVSLCQAGAPGSPAALSQNIPQAWRDLIGGAAAKYPDVDPRIVASVLWTEHRGWPEYKTNGWASSGAGARGPFQFIASSWFGKNIGWGNIADESLYAPNAYGTDGDGDGVRDPNNPRDAVEAAFKHHRGSAGKPIADAGFTGKADDDFNTVVFHRRDTNLLYYAAKYNGTGAPDGVKLKDFPKNENSNYVIINYWLLATDFSKSYDPNGGKVIDAGTNNKAGTTEAPPGSVAAADSNASCAGATGGGQLVGDIAWPVDKKFWDEHQNWFTAPHHDYPAADIPVPAGTQVRSMLDGVVVSAPTGGQCGQGVNIHSGDIEIVYCHGKNGGEIEGVKVGNQVKAGQYIMDSGFTGHVEPPTPAGAHLHVQIRVGNGQTRCPQEAFKAMANGTRPDLRNLPTSGCIK